MRCAAYAQTQAQKKANSLVLQDAGLVSFLERSQPSDEMLHEQIGEEENHAI